MNSPKITFLVNSGPDSIEAVRARGLARRLPPEKTRFLFRNGLLCDQQDAASVREQLARLAADPANARAMGLAARATIEQHTWAVCAEQTWSVYEQVLREKRAT